MKYRKRWAVVGAVRFDPCGQHRITLPDTVEGLPSGGADNWGYVGCRFFIKVLGGQLPVDPGDWIVTDPATGDTWPVKPDIFKATYEEVPEP